MPTRDYGRLAAHLTPALCDALLRDGYAVVDGFLGDEWAAALRAELLALAERGGLAPNRTHFAQPGGGHHLFSKPHIYEADLHAVRAARRRGTARACSRLTLAPARSQSCGRALAAASPSLAGGSPVPRATLRRRCATRCRSSRCAPATRAAPSSCS